MSIAISIILILASIVLIVAVLMQEGNKQGLGAIGGAAETFMGKSKAKSAEGKLLLITKITAAVFVVLAILATWNLRSYTVTYHDANGNEFYPSVGSAEANDAAYQQWDAYYKAQNAQYDLDDDDVKNSIITNFDSFRRGDKIVYAAVPEKTGWTGVWVDAEKKDGKWVASGDELRTKMGISSLDVVAQYTKNSYTLTIINPDEVDVEGATPFTVTDEYEKEISYADYKELEEKDGSVVFYSTVQNAADEDMFLFAKRPETIPAANTTLYANYAQGNFVEFYVPASLNSEEGGTEISEEYVEYFPVIMNLEYNEYVNALNNNYVIDPFSHYEEVVESIEDADKMYYRTFVKEGADLKENIASTPLLQMPEGKVLVWETEDGEEVTGAMGTDVLKVYAKFYDKGTVKLVDVKPEGEEDYTPAQEITLTGKVGDEITEDMLPAKEGYTVVWEKDAPTEFGAEETTFNYSFVKNAEENEDETEQGDTEPDTPDEPTGEQVPGETTDDNKDTNE